MFSLKKITFLILLAPLIFAQGNNSGLLKEVQHKFNSIHSIFADFVQKSNGEINLSGKFYFMQRNNIRLELKNSLIVSNGKTNWNYNKLQKKVIISAYDSTDASALSLRNIIFNYPDKCLVSDVSNDTSKILKFTAKQDVSLNFKEAKIYINKDYLPYKILIDNPNNNLIEIDFSNYHLNGNLSASFFKFVPPKGSSIVDLR